MEAGSVAFPSPNSGIDWLDPLRDLGKLGLKGPMVCLFLLTYTTPYDPDVAACDENPTQCPYYNEEKDLSDKISDISNKTGIKPKEVKERIHKAKQNIPRGTGIRNPDVKVDTKTGEVYPKTPDGGIGDSIGNIFDE